MPAPYASTTFASRAQHWLLLLLLLSGGIQTARASTIVPARDLGELALMSQAVVLAKAVASAPLVRSSLVYTSTKFEVLEIVRGNVRAGTTLSVETYGGATDKIGWIVPGSPQFEGDRVYLLFLEHNAEHDIWRPRLMSYGLLESIVGNNGALLLTQMDDRQHLNLLPRSDGAFPESIDTYYQASLLKHLRQVAAHKVTWNRALVAAPANLLPLRLDEPASKTNTYQAPYPCVFMEYQDSPVRWGAFDAREPVSIYVQENGDSEAAGTIAFDAVREGMAAWSNIPGVNINWTYAGAASYTPDCTDGSGLPNDLEPNQGLVQYNDPCEEVPDLFSCIGTLAVGGSYFYVDTHQHRDQPWRTNAVAYIIVNNGSASCLSTSYYREMITHELGHTLGFGHIPPANGISNMNPTCCSVLTKIDETCALFAYSNAQIPLPPGPVVLVSPEDGAATQLVTPELTWEAKPAALEYELQVSKDKYFSTLAYQASALTGTNATPSALAEGTIYYWRVRGKNAVGTGLWSPVWSFKTPQTIPLPITLQKPKHDAAGQPRELELVWSADPVALKYHVQVSKTETFETRFYENTSLTETKQRIGSLEEGEAYFWRVRGIGPRGAGDWSEAYRFVTATPPPGVVTLAAPLQNAVDVALPVELSWETDALSKKYQVQVGLSKDLFVIVSDIDTLTGNSGIDNSLRNGTTYFWRVRGINVAGTGKWSAVHKFTTADRAPELVSLLSPEDNAPDQPALPFFSWTPATGSGRYQLQISPESEFTTPLVDLDKVLTSTAQLAEPLAYGAVYYWRVRALNSGGAGPWSAVRRFSVAVGTGTTQDSADLPSDYALHQNYPNPFNPTTTIRFDLPSATHVDVRIYDVQGRVIATLVSGNLPAGRFTITWNAQDTPSGVYLCRLETEAYSRSIQVVLMK